jgi:hypothetical protein
VKKEESLQKVIGLSVYASDRFLKRGLQVVAHLDIMASDFAKPKDHRRAGIKPEVTINFGGDDWVMIILKSSPHNVT